MSGGKIKGAVFTCTALGLVLLVWFTVSASSKPVFAFNLNNLLKGFAVMGEGSERQNFQVDLTDNKSGQNAY